MIAVGKNKEDVVLLGTDVTGALVQIQCTEEEASSLLRQLAAVLGTAGQVSVIGTVTRRPAPALDVSDAIASAKARDEEEMAAQAPAGPKPGRAPTKSAEDLERQEARRQRLNKAGGGLVEGPVDE